MKGSVAGSALFELAVLLPVALGVEVDDVLVVVPAVLLVDAVEAGAVVVVVGAAGVDVALDGVVPVDGADELELGADECELGVEECELDVEVPLSGSMYC